MPIKHTLETSAIATGLYYYEYTYINLPWLLCAFDFAEFIVLCAMMNSLSSPASSRLLRRNIKPQAPAKPNHFDDSPAKSDHHSLSYRIRKSRFLYVLAVLICIIVFFHSTEKSVNDEPVFTNINNNFRKEKFDDKTVAFVVTITSCGGHKDNTVPFEIVEGASVLRYSIHQNSIHGDNHGQYDYQLYALYHPSARACAATLTELGYNVQAQDTPVPVSEIQNELLRERIVNNGCCGEKELIKLAAFTLTQHALVVLLDLDVLVLKPLDRLFDFMLDTTQFPAPDDLLYWNRPAVAGPNAVPLEIPTRIDLLYTTDYAMVNAERRIKPTQGGFVILRPNQTIYEDFVSIVKEGDFRFEGGGDLGWGGRTGRFWGGTHPRCGVIWRSKPLFTLTYV
jgi:hypothetical protein